MAPGSAWAEVLTLATKEGNESTDVTLAEEDREQVKAHKPGAIKTRPCDRRSDGHSLQGGTLERFCKDL